MEALKQILRTPHNHEIRIKIPDYVPTDVLVEIILLLPKKPNNFDKKIKQVQSAMCDELFMSDLKEVTQEFENLDIEEWEE
ncbi:MAG: hypothetical protein ACT6FF_02520 [Methanosarcinaceae archaeon]